MSLWVLVGIGSAATGAAFLGVLADLVGLGAGLGSFGAIGFVALGLYIWRIW